MDRHINGQTMPKTQNAALKNERDAMNEKHENQKFVDIFDETVLNAKRERLSHKKVLSSLNLSFDSMTLHKKQVKEKMNADLLSPSNCLNAINKLFSNKDTDTIKLFETCGLFKVEHDKSGNIVKDENGVPKVILRKATFDDLLSKPLLKDGKPVLDDNGKQKTIFCTLTTKLKEGETLVPSFQKGEKLYFLRPFTSYTANNFLSSIKGKHDLKMLKYDENVKELNKSFKEEIEKQKEEEKARKEEEKARNEAQKAEIAALKAQLSLLQNKSKKEDKEEKVA